MFKAKGSLAIVVLFLFVLIMESCGGGGGSSSSGSGGGTTTTTIGSGGGTAKSDDGNMSVEISQGTVTENVVVSITKVSYTVAGVDESIALSDLYHLKIEPQSNLQKAATVGKTTALTDIALGVIKVTFTNVKSATNKLLAKIGGIGGISTVGTTAVTHAVYSIKEAVEQGISTVKVYIPLVDISQDDYLVLYDPTLIREYTEQPHLKSFTKQRQNDSSPIGNKRPVILIHGINREQNLKSACDIDLPWCYGYKRDVWNTFYSLASDDFFNKFKVYEYIYPTFRSAKWSGQQLTKLIKDNSELNGKSIYIVAHSMGGLVARYAMSFDENGHIGSGIGANVSGLYTIATPHHGSIGASLLYLDQEKLFNNYFSLGFSKSDYTAFATATGAARGYYGSAAYTEGYLSLLWDNYDSGLTTEWLNLGAIDNGELNLFNQNIDYYKNKITVYAGGNILGGSLYDDGFLMEQLAIQAATVMATFGLHNPSGSPPNYDDSDGIVPRSSALLANNILPPYLSDTVIGLIKDGLDHQDVFRDGDIINDIISKISYSIADTTPPSIPTGLTATTVSSSQIDLSWNPSTDNVGVAGYKIYDYYGTYLNSVTSTSTSITGLNPNTYYCFTVSAYDAAGNESGQSSQACATTLSTPDLNDGLIAYYGFEGNANDSSGNGNHGTEYGGINYLDGKIGKAAMFDGENTYISVANNSSLRLNIFTITAWVRPDIIWGGNRIAEKGDSNSYWLDINPDAKALVGFYDGGYNDLISEENILSNNWYFIAGTYDGDSLKIYINGTLDNSLTLFSTPYQSDQPLIIGWKYNGITEDHFSGLIDELRIYNRALSESEIQELYLLSDDDWDIF